MSRSRYEVRDANRRLKRAVEFKGNQKKKGDFEFLWPQSHVSNRDLAIFCRQLSVLLDAGISLLGSLRVLEKQVSKPRLKQAILGVCRELERGESFAKTLKVEAIFPSALESLVRAGEAGGFLEDALDRAADFMEWEYQMLEKVRSAVTYPCVLLSVAALSVVFVIFFVLPALMQLLDAAQVEPPIATKALLFLSAAAKETWYYLFFLLTAAILVVLRWFDTPNGRKEKDRMLMGIPVFGNLVKKIYVARFCQTLSVLVKGGVPILQALEVAGETTGNTIFEEGVKTTRISVQEGTGMAVPLGKSGLFPPLVVEMISVGEESGSLDITLGKAGVFYEQDVQFYTDRLSAVLEPTLIICTGTIIGLILLSVFVPLYEVVGNVGL